MRTTIGASSIVIDDVTENTDNACVSDETVSATTVAEAVTNEMLDATGSVITSTSVGVAESR